MARASIEGRKIMTSRDEEKGKPGDEFEIEGVRFRLIDVLYLTMIEITRVYYRCEGFETPEECFKVISSIYPGRTGFDRLCSHFYARLP